MVLKADDEYVGGLITCDIGIPIEAELMLRWDFIKT